jgi:hypothetical protein
LRRKVRGHYLRRNHRRQLPHHILALDTESSSTRQGKDEVHRFRLGWTCAAQLDPIGELALESWRLWRSRYQLCRYIDGLAPAEGTLYVYGVNVFVDLQLIGFFYYLSRWGWGEPFIFDRGLSYILSIRRGKQRIRVLSVTNFWQASARALGAMLGLPKYDIDFERCSDEELAIYCFRDTEIAVEAVARWYATVARLDLGLAASSLAGQAYNCYRHRYMRRKILAHQDAEVRALEASGYYGGRCECWRLGAQREGPYVALDINSLYPYVMSSHPMPAVCTDYLEPCSLVDLADVLREHGAIAEVELDTPLPIYPLRLEGKLLFPTGRFVTVLCTGSLQEALRRGHLLAVRRAACYRMEDLFSEYVRDFYLLRLEAQAEGRGVEAKAAKLLLNSLYGKFACREQVIEDLGDAPPGEYTRETYYDMPTRTWSTEYSLFGARFAVRGYRYLRQAVVAIPAHVTDWGRMELWRIIEEVGLDRMIYCDTDSVIIRSSDLPRLEGRIEDRRLGALKVEGEYKQLTIYGPKDYRADSLRRCKGVPARASEDASGTWTYAQFLRQASHMRAGESSQLLVRTVTKERRGRYDKGTLNADGSISPYRLGSSS